MAPSRRIRLRRVEESRRQRFGSFLATPVGDLLALDTARRPRHRCEALGADRRFALQTRSKAALVYPMQCFPHITQERGVAVHVSNRHISFGRILNFIHLVRALLDRDAFPLSQYVSQLVLFKFENLS